MIPEVQWCISSQLCSGVLYDFPVQFVVSQEAAAEKLCRVCTAAWGTTNCTGKSYNTLVTSSYAWANSNTMTTDYSHSYAEFQHPASWDATLITLTWSTQGGRVTATIFSVHNHHYHLRFIELAKHCLTIKCQFSTYIGPRVGVTQAPFVNFSVNKIFDLAKVLVKFYQSHSYLTDVTGAELWRHLSNINMIFNS